MVTSDNRCPETCQVLQTAPGGSWYACVFIPSALQTLQTGSSRLRPVPVPEPVAEVRAAFVEVWHMHGLNRTQTLQCSAMAMFSCLLRDLNVDLQQVLACSFQYKALAPALRKNGSSKNITCHFKESRGASESTKRYHTSYPDTP